MRNCIDTYVSQVKFLFPVMGKTERAYLKKLRWNLEDCFEDRPPSSMEEVIEQVGRPEDAVSEYYDTMEPEEVLKHVRQSRLWRIVLICAIVILLVVAVLCVVQVWRYYQDYLGYVDDFTGYFTDTIQ